MNFLQVTKKWEEKFVQEKNKNRKNNKFFKKS